MSTYLITGGSGFLGRALTKRLLADSDVDAIRLLSRGEAAQAAFRVTLTPEERTRVRFILGDVRDADRMRRACHGADYVIHAAALKRVEVCQGDVREALLTNVMGSLNVAEAAIAAGCKAAVLISSDKAAGEVVNAYGQSKAMAEQIFANHGRAWGGEKTRLVIVRYGNVIGSTGSVFEMWRAKAERGETISVTNPRATRFFWPVEHACELALWALKNAPAGHMVVPKMRAATVADLVEACGAVGEILGDVHDAERVHETLITSDEMARGKRISVGGTSLKAWLVPPASGLEPKISSDVTSVTSDFVDRFSVHELRRIFAGENIWAAQEVAC